MEIAYYLPTVAPKGELIAATTPVVKKEVVHTKFFQRPDCIISLRPFCITRDMPVIQKWAWKMSRAANMVAASYMYTGASDFARSYMVMVNSRQAICQIDICQASKDELFESYHATPGDYIVRFLLNSHKKQVRPLHVKALQTSVEYFFSFPDVKQLVVESETDSKLFNDLLLKVGFRFKEKIYTQYNQSNVYVYPRAPLPAGLLQ